MGVLEVGLAGFGGELYSLSDMQQSNHFCWPWWQVVASSVAVVQRGRHWLQDDQCFLLGLYWRLVGKLYPAASTRQWTILGGVGACGLLVPLLIFWLLQGRHLMVSRKG